MKLVKSMLFASAILISAPASAATFIFDINIAGTSGNGVFSTQGDPSAGFTLVESLTGTFGGSNITLLAPGSFPALASESNDNLFTTAFPFFTFKGLSFSASGTNYNIWNNGGALSACSTGRSCFQSASFSVREAPGAVPEPGTWAMMLLGFGFVGGAMRLAKRRQKVTVSYA